MSTVIMRLGPTFGARAAVEGEDASDRGAFQRDARHFLKQVANRLKLRGHQYTISTRAASGHDHGEVVLRSGHLLLIVSMPGTEAQVSFARFDPGVTVAPESLRHVPLSRLAAPSLQREFLSWCTAILRPPPKARPGVKDAGAKAPATDAAVAAGAEK